MVSFLLEGEGHSEYKCDEFPFFGDVELLVLSRLILIGKVLYSEPQGREFETQYGHLDSHRDPVSGPHP